MASTPDPIQPGAMGDRGVWSGPAETPAPVATATNPKKDDARVKTPMPMGVAPVRVPFPSILLTVLLLAGPSLAQSSATVSWGTGTRRVEVPAAPSGDEQEVRISPGLSTLFLFDSGIQVAELEGRAAFSLVDAGQTTLRLVPSEQAAPGTRFRLRIRFTEGAAPTNASFALVLHPAQADSLVEVYQGKRTLESYRQEASEARAEARQCREGHERRNAGCSGAGGLRGLLASGVMDRAGVRAGDILASVVSSSSSATGLLSAWSYRSSSRAAVQLTLVSLAGAEPWKVKGATLTNKAGETLRVLPVWQSELLTTGVGGLRVVVEAEAAEKEVRGPFTLKLWDASGLKTVTLGNVTFP